MAGGRFLTSVQVTDFRSIAASRVGDLGDVTPLVGLNGSGKSNLMRALNLFFNGTIEADQRIDLRRDFREPGRQRKLRVAVEVQLEYGVFASLRHERRDALVQLASAATSLTMKKEWVLDPATRDAVTNVYAGPTGEEPRLVPPDQLPLANRLLSVVRFRYIPNHVHPSQILADEDDEIRRMLFDRLGKRQVLREEVVQSIGHVACELMQPVVDVMRTATGEVASVELATPADWRDLAWAFGMKLRGPQSQSFDALMHGSGVQSVLAYSILHAIDTSFSGSFGWRKGAIWAVGEPESFLHVGLQEELARLLVEYTNQEPLQVICSTHATPFLGVSDAGILTTMDGSGRTQFATVDRREMIRAAYSARIAPYAHALHTGRRSRCSLLKASAIGG
jgi:predicted ATPase